MQGEIDGIKMFTEVVATVKQDISAAGVKIIRLSPADAKKFYLDYRNAMWEEDMQRWPHIAPTLKEWLVDPNFARAQ